VCYHVHVLKDLIQQGELVFGDYLKRSYHTDQPNSIVDPEYTKMLISRFGDLDKSIQPVANPRSREEVLVNELERLSRYYVVTLSEELEPRTATPKEILDRYFIKDEDIITIKVWLKEQRGQILEANKRQFEFHSGVRKAKIKLGSKDLREKAEELVNQYLRLLKEVVRNTLPLPEYNNVLRDFIISSDSAENRASSNRIAKVCFVDTHNCTYMVNGQVYIDSVEFIAQFGHEVLGHCLNYVVTEKSNLPIFIKENYFTITSATRESVSEYFEKRLFELLIGWKDSAGSFDAFESLEKVCQRYKDTYILDSYFRKLNLLGLWILSTSKMDDYNKQMAELAGYSIEPKWVSWFLNKHRNNWNRSTGLLLPSIVSELRYSVESATKLLDKKKPTDINKFERAILTGAWSPDGFEEWITLTG